MNKNIVILFFIRKHYKPFNSIACEREVRIIKIKKREYN